MPSHIILHKAAIQTDGGTERDVGIAEMAEVEVPNIEHIDFNGLGICVENQTGTFREGDGWKVFMEYPYGYIHGVQGADGEELDCFVGPNKNAEFVFIIHIVDPVTDDYDEDKVFLGFEDLDEVVRVFSLHYNDAEEFIDEVSIMAWDDFLLAINKDPEDPDFSESAIVDSEPVQLKKDLSTGLVMVKGVLFKTKAAQVGEVREWGGVKYKKGTEGWEPVKSGESNQGEAPEGPEAPEGKPEEKKPEGKVSPAIKQRKEQIKEGLKSALKGIVEVMSEGFQGKAAEQTAAGVAEETGGEMKAKHAVRPEKKEEQAKPTESKQETTSSGEPTGTKSMKPSEQHANKLVDEVIADTGNKYDHQKLTDSIKAGLPAGYTVKLGDEPYSFDGEGYFIDRSGNKVKFTDDHIDTFLIAKAKQESMK